MDEQGFLDLCRQEGLAVDSTLIQFRHLGVTSVAPSEVTLKKLSGQGKVLLLRGENLPLYPGILARFPIRNLASVSPSVIVFVWEKKWKKWLSTAFHQVFPASRVQDLPNGFLIQGEWEDIIETALGFSPEMVKLWTSGGFQLDPRIENLRDPEPRRVRYFLAGTAALPHVSALIFSGLQNEILGFPGDLSDVAHFLKTRKIQFGFLESYQPDQIQKGTVSLAEMIPENVVKVQSLLFPPLTRIEPQKAVEIFTRGVKERNVRVVYYRPFLMSSQKENVLETNLDFLRRLRQSLLQAGFRLGEARAYPPAFSSPWEISTVVVGLLAATLLFLELFFRLYSGWIFLSYLVLPGITWVAFAHHWDAPWRIFLSLWTAILFPVLGILLFTSRESLSWFTAVVNLCCATLITVAGGIFVSTLLADNLSLTGVTGFRGVKVILILPVLLAPWLAWSHQKRSSRCRNFRDFLGRLFEPFAKPAAVFHLFLFFLFFALGTLMVFRSGNALSSGAVSPTEKISRIVLEKKLIVRPRFKEFLSGHPFFLLSASLGLAEEFGVFFLFPASLGQASIMDSFAHLHTPLCVTFLRTFHGLWIGIILGGILFWGSKKWKQNKGLR